MPRTSHAKKVSFTHVEKVYFPSGFTKGEMIQYYIEVAPLMLPHLKNRPVTLIRFPDGVTGESFYEKNAPRHAPDWIKRFAVPRRHEAGDINYILVNDVETLAWCANLGAIEFHPFLHRIGKVDQPTHIAFDLDPGEGADILNCVEIALLLKAVFDGLGLLSFPKVSGSKGLQIYVPVNTRVSYDATQPFAKSVAELLARDHPKLVVSQMPKLLRKGRVLIDWSQNSPSKTTVCVYSLRGKRPEPFVSLPVSWQELERALSQRKPNALFFTPGDALKRLQKDGDLFAPVLTTRQHLPKAFMQLAPSQPARGALSRYAAKRDFSRTAEPGIGSARKVTTKERPRFVIQKHAASRLHYDFRLEIDGTLKSWAVPKGPPYELGIKRAAFEVEDHPLGYLEFEGTIPRGQYGGGTVMVWDIGTYELLGGDWQRGDLKLSLHGKKLKGEWHIFRIKSEEGKPLWLLQKAVTPMKPLSIKRDDTSVLTGRSMEKIASDNDAQWQSDRSVSAKVGKTKPRASRPRSAKKTVKKSVVRRPSRKSG